MHWSEFTVTRRSSNHCSESYTSAQSKHGTSSYKVPLSITLCTRFLCLFHFVEGSSVYCITWPKMWFTEELVTVTIKLKCQLHLLTFIFFNALSLFSRALNYNLGSLTFKVIPSESHCWLPGVWYLFSICSFAFGISVLGCIWYLCIGMYLVFVQVDKLQAFGHKTRPVGSIYTSSHWREVTLLCTEIGACQLPHTNLKARECLIITIQIQIFTDKNTNTERKTEMAGGTLWWIVYKSRVVVCLVTIP